MYMWICICAYNKGNRGAYHGEGTTENEGGLGKISGKMALKMKAKQHEWRTSHVFPSSRDSQHKNPGVEVEVW